jgi:4-methyl-5(b-hydroxyethyl)-thiazole monophosphate biosynthesis
MCVGVLPVAESGLLRGGKATTYPHSRYHDNPGRLQELGCQATEGPVEVWNRIISCSGPAHSLDVAYQLLEHLIGPEASAEVQRYMVRH